jgi:hypothetical protein
MEVSVATSLSVRDIASDIRGWQRITVDLAPGRSVLAIRQVTAARSGLSVAVNVPVHRQPTEAS